MSLPKHIENAIWNYIPHMNGWTTPERASEMAERIIETKAKICVDIGVFAGRSTIAMGFAARHLGLGIVYGIDPWVPESAQDNDDNKEGKDWWAEKARLEDMQKEAIRAIWDHHLEQWIVLLQTKSEYCFQLFPAIDFLNIDGGHSEISSCKDVRLYLPRLKSNGYVMFDDCDWPTTQAAIKLIEEQCDLVNVVKLENESRTYRKR